MIMTEDLDALRRLFSFGIPGGRSKIQKAIGRYLDGDQTALDQAPTIKNHIDQAVEDIHAAAKGE